MNNKNEIHKKNLLAKTLEEKTNHKILFVIGCIAVFGFFDENVNSIGEVFSQYKIFWYYYCSVGLFILICLLLFNYFFSKKDKKIINFNHEPQDYFQENKKTKLEETNENLKDMIFFNTLSNALLLSLIFSPILLSFHDQIVKIYNVVFRCSYFYLEFVFRPGTFAKCVGLLINR